MKKLSTLFIFVMISLSLLSQDLVQSHANIAGFANGKAVWGDIDNDNDLDLLICGTDGSAPITKIYRNDGNDVFTDLEAKIPALSDADAEFGDYNADGFIDILISGWNGKVCFAAIYLNNGSQKFLDANAGLVGLRNASVDWVDYDNDGDLDIFYCGENDDLNQLTFFYENTKDNGFLMSDIFISGLQNPTSAWVDYDNDMDLDLLIGGSGFCYIYKNEDGDFYNKISVGPSSNEWSKVGFYDFDSDGDQDIFMLGSDTRLIVNEGNDSFSMIKSNFPDAINGSFCWGDFNLDGLADVAISAKSFSVTKTCLFINNGDRTFDKSVISFPDVENGTICMADIDNDFDLDILLSGIESGSYTTSIYYNNSVYSNGIPRVPENLTSTIDENSVVLEWSHSSDYETPAAGLTYNIFIENLVGGMSNRQNGFRRVVQSGNAGSGTSWLYKNLSDGIYTWNVQAIDNNYMGSKFNIDLQGLKKTFIIGEINSLEEYDNSDISIFPNPASDKVYIKGNDLNIDKVEIYAVSGKLVKTFDNLSNNEIDVTSLTAGNYLMIIFNKSEVLTKVLSKK